MSPSDKSPRPAGPGSIRPPRWSFLSGIRAVIHRIRGVGAWKLGLFGVVLLVMGCGSYLAFSTPPYKYADSVNHVGYSMHMGLSRTFPDIHTPLPVGAGSELFDRRVQAEPEDLPHRRQLYVANNPPHTYLVAAVAVRPAVALPMQGAELAAFRILSIIGYAGSVILTGLLARDLGGGDRRAGLLAAALLAATPSTLMHMVPAGIDGFALGATTGVTWALVRFTQRSTQRHALVLGGWIAGASAVRPMALAVGMAAAAIALAVSAVASSRQRDLRAWIDTAARVLLPAAVVSGWWYFWNVLRYGDPTGSAALFEHLGRSPSRTSTWDLLRDTDLLYRATGSFVRGTGLRRSALEPTETLERLLAFGAFALVITSGIVYLLTRTKDFRPAEFARAALPWCAALALAAVPILLVAIHRSGGGSAHVRYLLPTAIPLVPVSAGVLLSRARGSWLRIATSAAVVVYLVWQLTRLQAIRGKMGSVAFIRDPLLRDSLLSREWRLGALLLGLTGALMVVGAVAATTRGQGNEPQRSRQ